MEMWDLVKLYSRSIKSEHYIEAMSIGYQMLEQVFEFMLLKTTAGNDGNPLSKTKVNKAGYLLSKAKLAKEHDFITQDILDDVIAFNNIRKDAVHNMISKGIDYEKVQECAEMVAPIYHKVQSQFLTFEPGEWKPITLD